MLGVVYVVFDGVCVVFVLCCLFGYYVGVDYCGGYCYLNGVVIVV